MFVNNGDLICLDSPIVVTNNSEDTISGQLVFNFDVPEGLVIDSTSVTQGVITGTTWEIGNLSPLATATFEPCFIVDDSSLGPYKLNYTVSSSCGNSLYEGCRVLDTLNCTDVLQCVPPAQAPSTYILNGVELIPTSDVDGNLTYILNTPDADTDTRTEFVQVLPNGDWEFQIVDVISSNVLSTYTVPAGQHIEINSPNGSVTFNLNGNVYELEVEHTDNGDGSITLNDGTVIPAEVITSLVANPNGSYTYSSENGTTQNINYLFDTSHINVDGVVDLINSEGVVVSQLNLCSPACPPKVTAAGDETINLNGCNDYYGTVSNLVTKCNSGNTIIKYVEGTSTGGNVVVGANGEYIFTFSDCQNGTGGSFSYISECDDGTTASGTVILNVTPDTADSNDDAYAGPQNQPIVGSVAGNDVLCTMGHTTFILSSSPTNGVVTLALDGSFLYSPMFNFAGVDTFMYHILCEGVIADTSTVTITIIEASAQDDVDIVPADTTTVGLDATDDDTPCTGGSVTTYQWVDPLNPNVFGTIVGTPDNFSYTPNPGFVGVSFAKYDILCDGLVFGTATHYFYITAATPVSNEYNGLLDTPFLASLADNDFRCVNGGTTSFHLSSDDSANGTGLSEPTTDCGTALVEPDVIVTAFNQTTGEATITPTNGWQGTVCFSYFIRCTTPNGVYNSDPVTVTFNIIPPTSATSISCN